MQLDAWDLLLFLLMAYVATMFAIQQLFARRRRDDQPAKAADSTRSRIA